VRTHNVRWHRSTGWFGAVFGAYNIDPLYREHVESILMVPLWGMVAFSGVFAPAIYWRQQPEYHRRLVLIATCALPAAAFGRFPPSVRKPNFFYAGLDLLIILGVLRDWIVAKKIHPVYHYTLPMLVIGQNGRHLHHRPRTKLLAQDCARHTRLNRESDSPPGLCDSQFGVQRADQMLPDQVIKNEGNGSGERKNVSDESWNGKIQQAGCEHSERS
jgi:hypothetical protein